MTIYPYYWRVKTRYPERKGQFCRVIKRGKMNSCLVEFADGFRTITSRNFFRKHSVPVVKFTDSEKSVLTPEIESDIAWLGGAE